MNRARVARREAFRIWRRNAVGAWFELYRSIEARIRRVLVMAQHHYPKFVRRVPEPCST